MEKLHTVILTGGASRRMGKDKGELPFEGSILALRLAERFSREGEVCFSVGTKREALSPWTQFCDRFPGQGPLNGLVSGFEETPAQVLFLTAVDLPNGDPELAKTLVMLREDADACVIRRSDGKREATFAVYSRSCLAPARECLETGHRSFFELFERIRVRTVTEAELPGFDLDTILFNMNTPADYETIKKASRG